MADEFELRGMLQREAAGARSPELDTGRLVRRSRARRLPRQLAAGGAMAVAVLGLGVGAASGIRMLSPTPEMSTAGGGAEATDESVDTFGEDGPQEESGGESAGGSISLAPAYKINACGGMLSAAPADGVTGVGVTLDFPDEATVSGPVWGTVEVTNDTGEPLRGVMSEIAATTLSQGGLVLWHTPRLDRTLPVELQPGESTTVEASFEPRVCSAEDEALMDFPADLPPVGPGQYDVSVALDVEREDGSVLQVVSGTEPISLR